MGYLNKWDVQNHPAKYWGTMTTDGSKRKVYRSDGSVSVDKTYGVNARPTKKQQLRNANRAIQKAARRAFKTEDARAVDDYEHGK